MPDFLLFSFANPFLSVLLGMVIGWFSRVGYDKLQERVEALEDGVEVLTEEVGAIMEAVDIEGIMEAADIIIEAAENDTTHNDEQKEVP